LIAVGFAEAMQWWKKMTAVFGSEFSLRNISGKLRISTEATNLPQQIYQQITIQ